MVYPAGSTPSAPQRPSASAPHTRLRTFDTPYVPIERSWTPPRRHLTLGIEGGVPSITQVPEFRLIDTHYFSLAVEGAYHQRFPWVQNDLWHQWWHAGARFRFVGGASQNFGSRQFMGEVFTGVRQNIARYFFVGADLLFAFGYTEHNYGRGVAPRESFDINLGACLETGANLSFGPLHLQPYASYCYARNVYGTHQTDYIDQGLRFGLRVPLSLPRASTATLVTQPRIPGYEDRTPPPPTAPTCDIRARLDEENVNLTWDVSGDVAAENPSLFRYVGERYYAIPLDPDHPNTLSEELRNIPSETNYMLLVRGREIGSGVGRCTVAVSHRPIVEQVMPAPQPPAGETWRRYLQAPIPFANDSSDPLDLRGTTQGHRDRARNYQLEAVAWYLSLNSSIGLRIHGYANDTGVTDPTQRSLHNLELSRDRVLAVVRYLTRDAKYPVDPARLFHGAETYHGDTPPPEDGAITTQYEVFRTVMFDITPLEPPPPSP